MRKAKSLAHKKEGQTLRYDSGQAILVVVVLIGSIFMVTTAISGLLMFYQLEQAADAGNSTIAIFAADAGIERATYCYFYEYPGNSCSINGTVPGNGATYKTTATPSVNQPIILIHADGYDVTGRTIRALETTLRATATP